MRQQFLPVFLIKLFCGVIDSTQIIDEVDVDDLLACHVIYVGLELPI